MLGEIKETACTYIDTTTTIRLSNGLVSWLVLSGRQSLYHTVGRCVVWRARQKSPPHYPRGTSSSKGMGKSVRRSHIAARRRTSFAKFIADGIIPSLLDTSLSFYGVNFCPF